MEKQVRTIMLGNVLVRVIQGDVTAQDTDAIVNAANSSLMGGGGVDGAIHRAGGTAILSECKQIVSRQGKLPTGKAVITTGGNLKARYVIHTVGPVWRGGGRGEAELLASAYRESLNLATDRKLKSISFPSISTGVYGYPVDRAARVAISTVARFLQTKTTALTEIIFVLFDERTFNAYSEALNEIAVE
ncbi:MAG: O-acetyl-ADP-ribose deacetylase [Dehalococcoidales bacterium]